MSLVLQLLALGLVLLGFIVSKQKKYMPHGVIMLVASLMNIVSVLAVMIPVALRLTSIAIPGFGLLFRTHAVLGIAVIGVSGYILADWRLQKPGPTCFQRKKWMLGLALTWMAQVIIGVLLFLRLYQI